MTKPKPTSFRRLVPLAIIIVGAVLGWVFLGDSLSFEALRDNRADLLAYRDAHYLGAVLGFVAVYVVIVAFSLPGGALGSMTGGFLFGVFPGVLFNVTAATIGATAIFLAARTGLGDSLARRLDGSDGAVQKLRKGLQDNELSFLFLMRLVPAVPFFAANLVPALVGTRIWRFVWTTLVGIIPGTLVYTWIGAGLGEVFAAGAEPDLGLIFEPHVLGPILALCGLAALPLIVRLARGKATT
jgi:uncharacterized membrane protein YdjX (TVP38/TMEM64 family)